MDIDKQQVLELLYDAIEREDWSLVEEAIKVIKGEVDFEEFETDDDVDTVSYTLLTLPTTPYV